MERDLLHDPSASAVIGRLAYGHLGFAEGLAYAPEIPSMRAAMARVRIAPASPPDEPLLVLYDGTFLGTAGHGFVITEHRFGFRERLRGPRQILWGVLTPGVVRVRGRRVEIANGGISLPPPLASALGSFLGEMARLHGSRETTPYRSSGAPRDETDAGLGADPVSLLAWQHLGATAGLRYHPFIDAQRLGRARAALGPLLHPDEPVAAIYEDALREPEGFVITPENLAFHKSHRARTFRWDELLPNDIGVHESRVLVQGIELPWLLQLEARSDLPIAIAGLFRVIAAEARDRQARRRGG